jgi:hypothetical protein
MVFKVFFSVGLPLSDIHLTRIQTGATSEILAQRFGPEILRPHPDDAAVLSSGALSSVGHSHVVCKLLIEHYEDILQDIIKEQKVCASSMRLMCGYRVVRTDGVFLNVICCRCTGEN